MRAVTRGQSLPQHTPNQQHTHNMPTSQGLACELRITQTQHTQAIHTTNTQQDLSQQHTNTAAGPLPHVQPDGGTQKHNRWLQYTHTA
jgi:hypothetical protein